MLVSVLSNKNIYITFKKMSNKKVIGIDLGTGNSCVSVIENGTPNVIVNSEGSRTTPSVVYIDKNEKKVGGSAKRSSIMKPHNTVSFIKRFMGSEWNDTDVQKMLKQVTYEVVDKNNKPYVKIDDKEYSPEQISSFILEEMKKVAENYYGAEVKDAVITCPAWFNDKQRQATKTAGELAGLNVLRIINEPTAAILSSNIDTKTSDKIVMVADFGCGTLDFSICEVSDGMIEVLASYGDVFLGGQNYDNAIVDWLAEEFMKDHPGVDLRKDPMAYSRLVEAAEKAKCELSNLSEVEINLPYIIPIDNIPQMLMCKLNRAKFESLISDLNDRLVDCARKALDKSGKSRSDLDMILLVGGSTRIPSVQKALSDEFNVELNKSVNPDEAVALGAAIQANTIVGGENASDTLLLDVTPISLGIETMGSVMTKLVEANTTIPTSKTETFTTAVDNQPAVTIVVLQGERPMSKDNKVIGTFNLDGIAPAPKGVPQIDVTFEIDANGILSVSAKDKATGKEQHITIDNSSSLSEDEIKKIKEDAERFKDEDEKKRKELEKINQAQSYLNGVESALKDESMSSSFSDDEKSTIKEKVEALNKALDSRENIEDIEKAKEDLEKTFTPIITRIYQNMQNKQGASQETTSADGPQDVSFEEVK